MSDQVFAAYDIHSDIAANRPVAPAVSNGRLYVFVATDTHVASVWDGTTWCSTGSGGGGTVTTVSVVTANGVSGSVANPTTTPAITLTLGAITPTSVVASGAVSGSNLSGTNTGDQTITLTGDVTGSGTGSFATAVPFAHLPMPNPGGRLTLTTLQPVLQADVSNATTIFYTPYLGNSIQLYNGTNWTQTTFAELSQTLADTTKSPAAAAAGNIYDMLVWNDAGTIRCTRSRFWTTLASRGTGAGTPELIRQDGVWVNRFAVTNGPAALRGVYVGSIRTWVTAVVNMQSVSSGPGGGQNKLHVWNMYNRVPTTAINIDSSATHTYTSVTFQIKAANTFNATSFLAGLVEDQFHYTDTETMSSSLADAAYIGLAVNQTVSPNGPVVMLTNAVAAKPATGTAILTGYPALGDNFVYPLEATQATGVHTFETNNAVGGVTVIGGTTFIFMM